MERYKFPNSFIENQFVKYINRNEIKGIVGSLGHTLSKKYAGEELVLIGVLKGSSVFAADLMREIKNVKVQIDFVKLTAKGREDNAHGTICLSKDITTDIYKKNVIIIEEIIDTGRALQFLKQRLLLSEPKQLEILTLFDKPYKRAAPVNADYIGKTIDDQFIVGYGLDLEEYGRNFQDVYYLKYPN